MHIYNIVMSGKRVTRNNLRKEEAPVNPSSSSAKQSKASQQVASSPVDEVEKAAIR